VDDRIDPLQTIDKEALTKFGEGLDVRVLEKVKVALEARLTEHIAQVDRRLAEIDAQVALDRKAVDTHAAAQTSAVEKAIQRTGTQVRDYVTAGQQSSAEQIAGIDQRLSTLQEALPAKFREIVEAVRQSMEARAALELTELENRVKAATITPDRLVELEARLRGEIEARCEESAVRAADRIWQVLEACLQQLAVQPPPPAPAPGESIVWMRQKSASAEKNVLDIIAGIGQLFERPAPKLEKPVHVEPEPVVEAAPTAAPPPAPQPLA